jgi:hypothetical protein
MGIFCILFAIGMALGPVYDSEPEYSFYFAFATVMAGCAFFNFYAWRQDRKKAK